MKRHNIFLSRLIDPAPKMKTATILVAAFLGTLIRDVISHNGCGFSNNSDEGQAKKCPEKDIQEVVLEFPPYMILSDEENEATFDRGIVFEYIQAIFKDCCKDEDARVETKALHLESHYFLTELHDADIVFPVDEALEDELTTSGVSYAFYDIVHSPGYVLIGRMDQYNRKVKSLVLKSLYESWPIFVLIFLLTGIAGVLIWALVSYEIDQITNSSARPKSISVFKHYPKSFNFDCCSFGK